MLVAWRTRRQPSASCWLETWPEELGEDYQDSISTRHLGSRLPLSERPLLITGQVSGSWEKGWRSASREAGGVLFLRCSCVSRSDGDRV